MGRMPKAEAAMIADEKRENDVGTGTCLEHSTRPAVSGASALTRALVF